MPVSKSVFVCLSALALFLTADTALAVRVLVFSRVAPGSYRHASIEAAVTAIREIGVERGWRVDVNDDPAVFNHDDGSIQPSVRLEKMPGPFWNASPRF